MSEIEISNRDSEQSEEVNVFEFSETEQGFQSNLLIQQNLLNKILKQSLKDNFKEKDIFQMPWFQTFRRKNHIYYHVTTKEFHVDSCDTHGKVYLPLITREELNRALMKIPSKIRSTISTVHFGAVKILLKAEFAAGINYPVKMALLDNRINSRRDCVLGAATGNLAYQRFMFTVHPKFGMSIQTKNFDQTLSFVHEAERKDLMNKGDKVFSITYLVAFALSNSHHSIDYKHEEFISIDDVFTTIGTTVPREFVSIHQNQDTWSIDIAKDKPRIDSSSRSVYRNRLSFGEPSYRSQSMRQADSTNLLMELSEKVNHLAKVLEDNS